MSTRKSPIRFRACTVAGQSLTMHLPPLDDAMILRMISLPPSDGARPSSSRTDCTCELPATRNTASTVHLSSPDRTRLRSARSPSTRPSAPTSTDFPAPVSPVITLRPSTSSTATSSTIARFLTRNDSSMDQRIIANTPHVQPRRKGSAGESRDQQGSGTPEAKRWGAPTGLECDRGSRGEHTPAEQQPPVRSDLSSLERHPGALFRTHERRSTVSRRA